MSNTKDPMKVLAGAHEESYSRRRDEQLIEQLRDQMKRNQEVADLEARTQVADEALLVRLSEMGINADTVAILHLIPLLDVAWADGEVQAEERTLLLEAAEATGITAGAAREQFEGFLNNPPPQDLVSSATDFLGQLVCVLSDEEQSSIKANLVDYAWRIADACGGVFGLWGRVNSQEKASLTRIAERLSHIHSDASQALLERL